MEWATNRSGSRTASRIAPFIVLTVVTLAMIPVRDRIGLVSVTAFLLAAVITGCLRSPFPIAVSASIVSGFALNLFFMKPYGSIKINATEDVVGFIAYNTVCIIAVGLINSWKFSVEQAIAAQGVAESESRRAERGEQRITWLNQISHDIRTPLSTIRAVVGDMRDGVMYDDTTRTELLGVAADEVDRLDMLVGNWLVFGSMDSRTPETVFTAVDITEVVADSVRRLGPVLRDITVSTHLETDVDQVDGSYLEIQHLVLNLVTNAARHTPNAGSIAVSTATRDHSVVLIVDDSGPGFGTDTPDLLLQPYVVGEKQGSSGLGLAICAEVVKRHRGSIRLERSPMGGGRVVVEIPRRGRRRQPS